jgi:pimeloyl-ACP methyl ester carboxylesterase
MNFSIRVTPSVNLLSSARTRRVIVCTMLYLTSLCAAANAEDRVWYGTMDAGPREFRFIIQPASADAKDKWQLISLDEGGAVFSLDNFKLADNELAFELRRTNAAFSGVLSFKGDEAEGRWKQQGADIELILRRMPEAPKDQPDEIWFGDLSVLFQKLTMQLRVYRNPDGTESVRFDSVSQKAGGFKAVRSVKDDKWSVTVDGVKGTFDGKVSEDGDEVIGTWSQGGPPLELKLKRTTTAPPVPEKPKRPQTPVAPFPYKAEEVSFESAEKGVQLAGTLTIPEVVASDGVPAAILISGSGPQDRDETLLDHKPFAVIADALTRKGIAVLRFDDRGTEGSAGDFAKATSRNFADDVRGALRFLKADNRINAHRTGMIGHSEGGIVGPLVAADNPDVAFLIMLAGPAVNGSEILKSQGQLIMKAEGVTDPATLAHERATQEILIATILAEPEGTSAESLTTKVLLSLADQAPKDEAGKKAFEQSIAGGVRQLSSPWFRFFLTHDPAPVLKKVHCPVLALNGELDTQVDPKLNLPLIREILKTTGNPNSSAEELPKLNHLFQTCLRGAVSEYESIEETMAPQVLNRIADWILKVCAK